MSTPVVWLRCRGTGSFWYDAARKDIVYEDTRRAKCLDFTFNNWILDVEQGYWFYLYAATDEVVLADGRRYQRPGYVPPATMFAPSHPVSVAVSTQLIQRWKLASWRSHWHRFRHPAKWLSVIRP